MISRYTRPELGAVWTDEARMTAWRDVEVAAAEGLPEGPSAAELEAIRGATFTVEAVREREAITDHDVAAFVDVLSASAGPAGRWIHFGLTSSDVLDTALALQLRRAGEPIVAGARELAAALGERAREHAGTLCVGRTHGVHAEPTTFGHKLAGYAFALDRSVRRLRAARQAVAVGTVSGAVGTYALIDPYVERYVCAALGLGVEPAPSQVVARDRHAELVQALALLGACVEQVALELRMLQRTEVREVEERRSGAYQGSSAMPHKRNPTASERVAGLARLLRGHAQAMLEGVALWHERDLAHESVERVVVPDALTVAHFQVTLATELVATLAVFPDRMRAAVDHTGGLVHSSAVLADLLADGVEREKAYRVVQAAADRVADGGGPGGTDFGAALAAEGIDPGPLRPERYLVHHRVIRARLDELAARSTE